MARIRQFKPGFFTDDKVGRLSRDARLFFFGVLSEADDEGRLVDAPKRLAGVIYPFDDDVTAKKVEKWIDELEAQQMVLRYTHGGGKFLYVRRFKDHQKMSHPTPSILPPPPSGPGQSSGVPPEKLRSDSGEPPEDFAPEGVLVFEGLSERLSVVEGVTATPLSAEAEASPPSSEVVPINGHPPAWLAVVGPKLAGMDTTGTWDLLEPYVEAWDVIHDTIDPPSVMGNLIALTCDFVTRVTGEPPPESDRGRIAMLVRQHGKAALLGYSKALGATQDETPEARFRYARGVVNRFIAEAVG